MGAGEALGAVQLCLPVPLLMLADIVIDFPGAGKGVLHGADGFIADFQFLPLAPDAKVLDCGCGGGANLAKLLKACPAGIVKGIDYSPVSVERAQELNRKAIQAGRCVVTQGSVQDMLFAGNWFDAVTAFETVYFWPELPRSFREVRRVLKPGGTFLLCNECGGGDPKDEKWTEKIPGMTIYTPE